jgi:hypothetical protein
MKTSQSVETIVNNTEIEKIHARNQVEKRGFVAVGAGYEGGQRYINMTSREHSAPTTNVYGNRP